MNKKYQKLLKNFDARAIALAFILEQLILRKKNDK
tara:strand:+ start:112 stop:216 length:105 start_codon:yes stop_codon:yes gene_type:complete